MVFSNYRPVSILPVFSKLLERLMYNRLINFINIHGLLYEYQFGFQKDCSTYMALISLMEKISMALDNGEYVIGVFLDFSKAFDTVDHDILLQKLNIYGVRGVAHTWFKSYLANRYQYVTYNNAMSQKEKLTCGVPQGSILGPLLFLIYINDLSTVSNACLSILFADDTNMFRTGTDLNDLCNALNDDLSKIQEWLRANKLSLNVKKTHYMIFCGRGKKAEDVPMIINGEVVERVYVTKFLGVYIDAQLSWKHHIDYTCKKLSKSIGILSKARRKLSKNTLISLYYSFSYPYLIYCNQVWGNTYPTNLNKLQVLQKKIVRIITSSSFQAHSAPLLAGNKLLNTRQINLYVVGNFMYKYVVGSLPPVFHDYFVYNREISTYETRRANDFCIPFCRTNIRQFTIRIHGAKLWNSIPEFIRNAKTLDSFKIRYKKYLLEHSN